MISENAIRKKLNNKKSSTTIVQERCGRQEGYIYTVKHEKKNLYY